METYFLKLKKGCQNVELARNHPKAYLFLMSVIAERVEWGTGRAFLGDYKEYGMTRQEYRTALGVLSCNQQNSKKQPQPNQQITIKTTNKGTVVYLLPTAILEFGTNSNNHQNNHNSTNKQPTKLKKTTTNIDIYKDKEKNSIITCTNTDLEELSKELSLPLPVIRDQYQQMLDWIPNSKTGRAYQDYKRGLRNWVKRALTDGRIKREVRILG
jgi:hypothetical protein